LWKLVGYLYREVCNAMESMCVATNTTSFKAFTDDRHVLIAETCVSHDHDPQWLFPRVLFRGRQFHKLGGYHPFAALLQVLIAFFTKILSAVLPQAESEQTGGTKAWLPCSGGRRGDRNILTAQPTRHGTSPSDGGHGCLYSYFSSSFTSANALVANSSRILFQSTGLFAARDKALML
jgi:hypothetical protein